MKRNLHRVLLWAVVAGLVVFPITKLYAAEHPGKEQPGATTGQKTTTKEHAGATQQTPSAKEHAGKTAEPSNQEIRMAMQAYAMAVTGRNGGSFPIHDDKAGKDRKLSFQRIHERVGKLSTQDGYFSCADFVDQESGEKLDVDFWVMMKDGKLEVTNSEIHKVNDKPRFTYNEKDEKVMLN